MRTKTPKQIYKQEFRLLHLIVDTAKRLNVDEPFTKRYKRVRKISSMYRKNIYNAAGVCFADGKAKCNEVWTNYAVPASVYAKQV